MLKKRTMLGAACVLLSAVEILSSNAASGGIINLTVVEDKGLFQDIIQIDIFSKTSGVLIDPPLIVLIQRTNFEKFQIPIGLPDFQSRIDLPLFRGDNERLEILFDLLVRFEQ